MTTFRRLLRFAHKLKRRWYSIGHEDGRLAQIRWSNRKGPCKTNRKAPSPT